jgi:hypothetical protein
LVPWSAASTLALFHECRNVLRPSDRIQMCA